ncbi:MAG: hypothetical protein ACI867_000989 [Glaciecola sp.]|jgi:hypothetical protein
MSEAELRARLRDIERHLVDMPPHNASGSRDDLQRQRVALERELSARAKAAAVKPAAALPDPRAGAPREPALRTPAASPGAFRRTTHVAAGPSAGQSYGEGIEVTRDLHGACRDVRAATQETGRHEVLDEASITGHLDVERAMVHLAMSGGEVPHALIGQAALPGLRGLVTQHVHDVSTAASAVLLDLGIGGTLAAYGRMQAGRKAGQSTAQVVRPGIVDRLGDSCRGWARDGAVVRNLLAGVQQPRSLPPVVIDPDQQQWHDLGPLPPGWVRRRRRIDVATRNDGTTILAAFRDSWVDDEDIQHSLHEWELHLELDVHSTVVHAQATPRSLPFGSCPLVASEVPGILGVPIDGLRHRTRDVMGGVHGCTHLNDLLSTIPLAVTAARRPLRMP